MVSQRCLPFIFVMMSAVIAEPAPGRIPKVYNALITSNQNLDPSKAFPLYQPVLQNAFPYSYQTIVYDDFPQTNGLVPMQYLPAKDPNQNSEEENCSKAPEVVPSVAPAVGPTTIGPLPLPQEQTSTPVPPPPSTESPIPLNQFGLPPQVLPIGQINPNFKYPQLAYPYPYPGLQFYNPYNPYGFNPFPNYPFYQPPTNILQHPLQIPATQTVPPAIPTALPDSPTGESNEINVFNYSSKDPAIPNVPPPPLPEGGLKTNEE